MINKEAVLEYFMNDKELLIESIELFSEKIPKRLNDLKKAVIENNFEIITIEAHSLKGMVAFFTTKKVYELAKELELMGREKNPIKAKGSFNSFLKEIKLLNTTLNTWKKELN